MVASDTVVGLVGAGILLVALVGVFVYESNVSTGGPSTDLKGQQYIVDGKGSGRAQQAVGTRAGPMNAICVPPQNMPQAQCQDASTRVDLTLTGLPDPREAAYVVFGEGGTGAPVFIAKLEPRENQTFTTNGVKTVNQYKPNIRVTLESSGTASAPSGPTVFRKDGLGATDTPITGNATVSFLGTGVTTTVVYAGASGGTNVTITLTGAQRYTSFEYRAWMVKDNDAGLNFTCVCDTAVAGNVTTVTGVVSGSSARYDYLVVTLEPKGPMAGSAPKGPTIART